MIEVNYHNNDFVSLLHPFAKAFHTQIHDNLLRIPDETGRGFFVAYNLPVGLSVLLSDTLFYEDLLMQRSAATNRQYFILQFNESLDEVFDKQNINKEDFYTNTKNGVLLSSSLMDSKFIIPGKVRIRSVQIIFENDFLASLIGNEAADKFLSNYFSMILKGQKFHLMGTDYRIIMDEIIKDKIDHPLKMKFIYNRIMLLIEKLVIGFINNLEKKSQVINLKDDEISRLIKVEALLVKNYSVAPAVIAELSKVAAMSATKLKKDFKALYGLPIYEYYQKNRMLRAKGLLLEGRYAVKEVGMMVGYSNIGHFAGSFKKEFGVLPSDMISSEWKPKFIEKKLKE